MTFEGEEDMPRKAFSTTKDSDTPKALKLVAVKRDRSMNAVLEEAVERYLTEEAIKDPDAQIFLTRAKEPLVDCMAAIERRFARIKRQRGWSPIPTLHEARAVRAGGRDVSSGGPGHPGPPGRSAAARLRHGGRAGRISAACGWGGTIASSTRSKRRPVESSSWERREDESTCK
jgi:hypothetical protein